jgi:hypothetical protein
MHGHGQSTTGRAPLELEERTAAALDRDELVDERVGHRGAHVYHDPLRVPRHQRGITPDGAIAAQLLRERDLVEVAGCRCHRQVVHIRQITPQGRAAPHGSDRRRYVRARRQSG